MGMFADIFKFELHYHRRQYLVYILFGVFFLLTFMSITSPNVSMGGVFPNININAPIAIISTLSTVSIIGLFGAIAFVASGVIRDFDLQSAEIFFSTRVSKFDYIYGRFFGALMFSFVIYLGGMLGALAGEFMPWLDSERIGPFSLEAYWFSTWAIVLPNLFVASCIFFCIATLTRSMMFTYVAAIAFLMLTFVVGSFTEPDTVKTTSLLDPFGIVSLQETTRYWTVFEKNEVTPVLEGTLLINRIVWMLIGLGALALSYFLFPFSVEKRRKAGKKNLADSEELPITITGALELPDVARRFDTSTLWYQYLSQTRLEIRNIIFSAPFIVLMLLGLLNVVGSTLGNLGNIFGTSVYPVTPILVNIINGSLSLSLLAVVMYYSGELMTRERTVKLNEILDSLPYPNWVMMAAKLSGLLTVVIMMLLVAMLAGVGIQLSKQFYDFDLLVYIQGLFFFFQFPLYFMCVLSLFFYVITRSKYMTMFLLILYVVAMLALPNMGWQHYLYLFNKPGVQYSAFTGFEHQFDAWFWYTIYWSLWGSVLLITIHLLWPRGSEDSVKSAFALVSQRFTGKVAGVLATTLVLVGLTGSYIFFNTNVLNDYVTSDEREDLQAEYEKKYKQFQYRAQPAISAVYAEVDIFPEDREVLVKGYYSASNNSSEPITDVHFTVQANLTMNRLDIEGATLAETDEKFNHRVYKFEPALQPGESIKIEFETAWLTPGFVNNGTANQLAANGTFFNNLDAFPIMGYRSDYEIQDNSRRREHDLEALQRLPKIDDEEAWMRNGLGNADRVDFETIVSTSAEQFAIAPGYLQKEWKEDSRSYYHYKMDAPIWNFFSYLSGDYEVKKDQWNDVAIEVYYLHDYNIDRMIHSTKQSLEYFSENFSPYQYRQFRILEFPRFRGAFAQSFPNTIPFSEAIGFVADLRDKANIDYVFYVTAHELAHQWWAHQVLGAGTQGYNMIVESLSQYSALMVMKQEYGEEHMKQFLSFELDRYLRGRGGELIEELPLALVENQQYIHYRKGSVVLYALQDYIGEDRMNAALADFIEDYAFKGPPYPTTRDLIARIREQAEDVHQPIITDLLEKIVLYDLKIEDVQVEEVDGEFDIVIDISAKKFEADGFGEETEVSINGLFDLALLGEEDDETELPTVLYSERVEINEATQTIRIRTDTRPVSVGVDPFNKMIDRNPDDNIKKLET